jgi:protein-S-isoprenylcysteine O-methyltransferase Ste14
MCIALLTYFGEVVALDVVMLLQVAAVGLGLWAVRSVGDNNWSVYPVPNPQSSIANHGAYKYVRHPMYTALILFFLPVALRADGPFSWGIYSILVGTLCFKIGYEERQILLKHPEYADFKKVTKKRLIPFVW